MFNPLACEWAPTILVGLSANVSDNVIYYSHYGPLLLAIAMFFFIFFTDRTLYLGKVLMTMIAFVCLWIMIDMYLWVAGTGEETMFFWTLLVFFETSIYVSALYFTYVFVQQKAPHFFFKCLGVLLYLAPAILLPTKYTLEFFDLRNCDRDVVGGPVILYLYVPYGAIMTLIALIAFYGAWKQRERAREILTVSFGVLMFLATFFWGLVAGSVTEDWLLSQAGLFGLPVFIGFLAYAIARYETLRAKLVSVQFFGAAVMLLIGAQFFFVEETLGIILIIGTLILTTLFSMIMTRAIKTELKRKDDLQELTISLTTANKQLKELDNAKTEFLSIASHQLRTPLTAIKGYISLILEGSYGEVSATVQDVLNKLYLVNSRMVNLAEDLLNVTRIDAGRVQYNYHKAVLEKVLQEAVEVFRLTAQEKGLDLNLELPEMPLPEMTIDARKIQEVCSNLIDNSIKYTKTGSVAIKLMALQDRAVISVQDTGIGILPENKDKLFAKFVRSKETNILDVSGTGLGLYVGKNFVEAHGGRIYAESDGRDKGSKFIIELPYINPMLNQPSPNWMINP